MVITGLTAYWLNTGFQVDAQLTILGSTRLLEGASTAASVPSILGFIALATAGNELLRGKAAARFEGATLAGLGFGFIVAPTLFAALGADAFYLNAVVYGISFLIYWRGVKDPQAKPRPSPRPTWNPPVLRANSLVACARAGPDVDRAQREHRLWFS